MNSLIQNRLLRRLVIPLIFWMGILLPGIEAEAQQKPPRPMSITSWQELNFGTFCAGGIGDKVTISAMGVRSASSPSILLLSSPLVSQAKFDVTAINSTLIHIIFGSDVDMNGSNGGQMTLKIGPSEYPDDQFVSGFSSFATTVRIGGTLTIKTNPLPAGNYSCTFEVIFIQE